MRLNTNLTALVSVLGLLGSPALGGDNLIVNGGFETGDFTGWTLEPSPTGSDFGVVSQPHTGNFAARFSGDTFWREVIYQEIPSEPWEIYTLTFSFMNFGQGNDMLYFEVNGTQYTNSEIPGPLGAWQTRSINIQSWGTGLRLGFGGYDLTDSFLIDDISVTPIPAPGVVGLLGTAVFGLGCRPRRHARSPQPLADRRPD